jgi:hypothetical protein
MHFFNISIDSPLSTLYMQVGYKLACVHKNTNDFDKNKQTT